MTTPAPSPIRGDRPFPAAAAVAVASPTLRRTLRNATGTIRAKRDAVVAELDDWEALRDAGETIKTDAMARLPELLEQLEANVTARGGVVHWARDAEEANRIVTDLVAATGHREVVKIKSMATQEIGLNEALEQAGIRAIETDLAELIVQLADDRPSHILVPAIHLDREQIRDVFRVRMEGAPPDLTSDPPALAEAARIYLRECFLSAHVAISGANAAMADTGTVMVVESEGNGRMCLSLPETLITVMGVEKVLPTWQDQEVFMQLLPRSSTGERMNPYTSTWTGVIPGDGPQEFHLVLVDNGRSDVLADPEGRAALHCIRCSACLNVCPVYERTGGHAYGSIYPGPIGAVLSPQLTGISGPDDPNASLPFASTLCGACLDACPVKIDIPAMLVHLRSRAVDAGRGRPSVEQLVMRAAGATLARPRRLGAAQRFGRIVARITGGRVPRWLPGPGRVWARDRELPPLPGESFRSWWRRTERARRQVAEDRAGRR